MAVVFKFLSIFAFMKRYFILFGFLWMALTSFSQEYVKLMTYNVRNAKGLDGKRDIQRVADVILSGSPDVVAIQEVDSMSPRNYCHLLGELGVRTGMHAYFAPAISLGVGSYGVGVLSKRPPIRIERIHLPGTEERRVMLIAEFDDYVFCCTHLSLTPEDRMRSLEIICTYAEKSVKPFFLAGDLNARPESEFIDSLKIDYSIMNDVDVMTFPASEPNRTLDYIALWRSTGTDYVVASSRVIADTIASDHRPVLVTLRKAVDPDSILSSGPYQQRFIPGITSVSWLTNVPSRSWVEYTIGDGDEACHAAAYPLYHDDTVHRADIKDVQFCTSFQGVLRYRICSQELLSEGRVGHTAKSEWMVLDDAR